MKQVELLAEAYADEATKGIKDKDIKDVAWGLARVSYVSGALHMIKGAMDLTEWHLSRDHGLYGDIADLALK